MPDVAMGESSITEYIDDYNELDISYNRLFFKEKNTFESFSESQDVIMTTSCILDKYKKDLDTLLETRTLTDDEQRKYFCNPWMLSYDLYGTVEFWFLLLEANNLYSATEFTQATIKVYNGSLPAVIESILALEEEFINSNEEELNDDNLGTSPEMLEYLDDENEDEEDNIYEEE